MSEFAAKRSLDAAPTNIFGASIISGVDLSALKPFAANTVVFALGIAFEVHPVKGGF